MAQTVSPAWGPKTRAGHASLVFGALFTAAFAIVFHWLMWAFTGDFFYAFLPSLSLAAIMFACWWLMAHRVQVETREGRLH